MNKVSSYKFLAFVLCLVNFGLAALVYHGGFTGPLFLRLMKVASFAIFIMVGVGSFMACIVRILPTRTTRPHVSQPVIDGDDGRGHSGAVVFWLVLALLAVAACAVLYKSGHLSLP